MLLLYKLQQHLEGISLSEVERLPFLLPAALGTPKEVVARSQHLKFVGATPYKRPLCYPVSFKAMQSTLACLQAFGFTQAQIQLPR